MKGLLEPVALFGIEDGWVKGPLARDRADPAIGFFSSSVIGACVRLPRLAGRDCWTLCTKCFPGALLGTEKRRAGPGSLGSCENRKRIVITNVMAEV